VCVGGRITVIGILFLELPFSGNIEKALTKFPFWNNMFNIICMDRLNFVFYCYEKKVNWFDNIFTKPIERQKKVLHSRWVLFQKIWRKMSQNPQNPLPSVIKRDYFIIFLKMAN
jgi:hypothetical protein